MQSKITNISGNIYNNWHYHLDSDNVLWLAIDCQNKSVNALSQQTVTELRKIVSKISDGTLENIDNKKIVALIIYSSKSTGFIAGADITEFTTITNPNDAITLLENGQNTMQCLEELKIPTICMVDGFCLGGGLELALSCDYIVASDNRSTKIGLPEVMLGIIPGWGGTVRLPKKIGAINAIPMMMQGQAVSGISAYKLGIVDACVPIRQLKRTARYFALNKSTKRSLNLLHSLFEYQPFRSIFAYFARKQLVKKVSQDHYPAPYAVLDKWEKYGVDSDTAFKAEITYDLEVIQKPTARNLISVFFLQEKLKELAKISRYKAAHVHVIGAGTMGGDIAAWCAFKGLKVTLQDQTYASLSAALARAAKLFKSKLKKDDLVNLMLDKIIPDIAGNGIKSADVIIEAVFENLAVKQELFKKIECEAKPQAILATNTSSILIDDINQVLTDKSRLVGIHFFNPVAKMMLVEVVSGKATDSDVAAKAGSFVNQIGKLALPVASSPGFLVNRVLSAYMHETFILLSEGFSPETIDKAMKSFGMLMGPVEMADVVGLDICMSVANNMALQYGEDVPKILKDKVEAKQLGKKTGKGFYDYKNGKIVKNAGGETNLGAAQQIIERLTMRILNICVTCLREKVVAKQEYIDAGLIFGAGFAPFRGGPINYLLTLGKDIVVNKLNMLSKQYGNRFNPDPGFDSALEVRGNYDKASGE